MPRWPRTAQALVLAFLAYGSLHAHFTLRHGQSAPRLSRLSVVNPHCACPCFLLLRVSFTVSIYVEPPPLTHGSRRPATWHVARADASPLPSVFSPPAVHPSSYRPPTDPWIAPPLSPQTYEWDYFLVAACFQLVGLLMWIAGAQLLKRLFGIEGPGISGLLRPLPGFSIITGGCWTWNHVGGAGGRGTRLIYLACGGTGERGLVTQTKHLNQHSRPQCKYCCLWSFALIITPHAFLRPLPGSGFKRDVHHLHDNGNKH